MFCFVARARFMCSSFLCSTYFLSKDYIYMYVLYSINSQDGGEAAGFKTLPKHMISHITWRPTRRGLTKEGAPQHFRTMTSCFILIPRDPSTFSEGDWRLFMSWRAQVLSEKVCGSLGFFLDVLSSAKKSPSNLQPLFLKVYTQILFFAVSGHGSESIHCYEPSSGEPSGSMPW